VIKPLPVLCRIRYGGNVMSEKYLKNYCRYALTVGILISIVLFGVGIALFLFPRVVLSVLALVLSVFGAVIFFSIISAVYLS